jgi:hypothetical protein
MVYFLILALLIIGVILMTIYFGNKKIGKLNFGGISIGEVYKGNQLVYQSGPSLKLYGITTTVSGYTFPSYLVGSYSTSGLIAFTAGGKTITRIYGNLGQSGSVVYCDDGMGNTLSQIYYRTSTINGLKIYEYGEGGSNFNLNPFWVLEGSKVGSTFIMAMSNCHNPSSVTSTTVVGGGYTYTRDSSRDATWSLSGIK